MGLKSKLKSMAIEFIYGGHLLSLGASAIVLTVIILLGIPINWIPVFIAYFISQIVYTYDHYRDILSDSLSNPERSEYLLRRKRIIEISLLLYAFIFLLLILYTNLASIILSLVIVIGGILYTSYFKKHITRRFAGFKNIYTSFFWAILIFLVPFFYGEPLSLFYILFGIFVFFRLFVNTVYFDIKDIESDSQDKLKTFATLFGERGTLIFLQVLNILSLIPLVWGIANGYIPGAAYSLALLVVYSFLYLTVSLRLNIKQLRVLSYVVVDGEYIFWPIIVTLILNLQ